MAIVGRPWARRVLTIVGAAALLLALAAIVGWTWLMRRPIHVEDGFEGTGLSRVWSAGKLAPGAFSTESEIVHSGHRAGKITVHPNNRFEAGSSDGPASERDELMEASWSWSQAGKTYDYRFSLYLPQDFPIVGTRLVIAQWKQLCEWPGCLPDNPVLAVRYVGGILFVTRKDDAGQATMYRSQGEMRGRWLSFRFVARFSQKDNGVIDGWINGLPIVQYHGVTAYHAARGYPAHGFFYFKMGLYRDLMKQPMTIYLDDFRKDQCGTPNCQEYTGA